MTKSHFLLALRIAVAAGGLAYIGLTLTWSDHVLAPEGTVLPDGSTLDEPTAFTVVEGKLGRTSDGPPIRLLVPSNGQQQAFTMTVELAQLGSEEDVFQPRPGVVTTLRGARVGLLLLALIMIGPIYPIQSIRWWMLMRSRGLTVTPWKSFRLVMVGCFFNYCMPGTTGGDVLKAYYAAKNSGRRADAVMSVVFDRITGLLGLIVLGGVAGLCMLDDVRARPVTAFIWSLAGFLGLAAAVYFTPMLRRRLGVNWLVSHLPGRRLLESVDRAAVAYRHHKREIVLAILISVGVHLCLTIATSMVGYALGVTHRMGLLITVLPVLFVGAAVPISYQGLGIMEGIGIPLLVSPSLCTANQLISMLVLLRLFMVVYALAGALFLLRGDIHMHPQEIGEEAETTESISTTSSPAAPAPS